MTKRLRPWVGNFLLLCISIIFFLIILEIGLRILSPQQLYVVRSTPWLERENIPNMHTTLTNLDTNEQISIDINSKGFRDHEIDYEKPDNTFRILVLGDSFTEARQVQLNETFHKLLETKLNNQNNKNTNNTNNNNNINQYNYQVIAAGVSGYGTENNLAYLNEWGLRYEPDIVILQFLGNNDIRDNYFGNLYLHNHTYNTLEKNYPLKYSLTKRIFDKVRIAINSRLHIGVFFEKKLTNLNIIESILLKTGLINKKESQDVKQSFTVEAEPWTNEIYHGWDETKLLIKEMNTKCNQNNAHLIIMLTPTDFQVYDEEYKKYEQLISTTLNKIYNSTKVELMIIDFAQQNDINYLYLLPKLIDSSTTNDYFGEKDTHFTKLGHELTSNLIYEKLINNDLLPFLNEQTKDTNINSSIQ
tara:strand:+ start:270 stop:1517 length:1248 start_codon:yes stop_codon:yes gene_type:complete